MTSPPEPARPAPAPAPALSPTTITAPGTAPRPAAPGPVTAPTAPAAAPRAPAAPTAATPPAPGSIELKAGPLELPPTVDVPTGTSPVEVPVHVGTYARGVLALERDDDGLRTRKPQALALTHPALAPLNAALEPTLVVQVAKSEVSGRAAVGPGGDLAAAISTHQGALGWLGLDLDRFPQPRNQLGENGLEFVLPGIGFSVGKLLDGAVTFGLSGEAVVFDGTATVQVAGQKGTVAVARDEGGGLTITGDLAVTLGPVAATLHAQRAANGAVDVRGKATYRADKFSGEITIVVADEDVADQLARAELGLDEAEQPAPAAPTGKRSRPGAPVPVGWGTLDFAVTDWLAGKAKVLVGPKGHVTVLGDITPPAEAELFAQRDVVEHLFTLEARAIYGIPVVGNLFVFANVGMDALAKLGPAKLHSIVLSGRYSTDPKQAKAFSVAGTLTISAFAGLRLRGEGGAGITIADHDIKAGVGINGLAGVRGYVEATPTIGMREQGEPGARRTEFYLKGHLELAAQPFLGLSGDLFVELDSPFWSPAPDKKWTWPIGSLEYPLPGEFGISADIDHVIGSPHLPTVTFGRPTFDSSKFITDLVNDKVPPKSTGDQQKPGEWKEGQAPGPAQGEVTTGGAPAAAPATTAPAGPGGKDQHGTPAPKTAKPEGPGPEGTEGVPALAVQKRWTEGMKALSALVDAARKEPLDAEHITSTLAELKRVHGFTTLEAAPIAGGEQWSVLAEMRSSHGPTKTIKIAGKSLTLPMQIHHFASDKNKYWSPLFAKIAAKYSLDLDEQWNKEELPHRGPHPDLYHELVHEGMLKADTQASGSQKTFLKLYEKYVKAPVRKRPQLLRKAGWG